MGVDLGVAAKYRPLLATVPRMSMELLLCRCRNTSCHHHPRTPSSVMSVVVIDGGGFYLSDEYLLTYVIANSGR